MGTLFKFGGETLVNTVTAGTQQNSSVAALDLGRYLVTWEDSSGLGGDASGTSIKGKIFNPAGSVFADEFLVNQTTAGNQTALAAVGTTDGRAAVAYKANGSFTSLDHILVREFDTLGRAITNPSGNSEIDIGVPGYGPYVAPLPNGSFVVTGWYDFGQSDEYQSAVFDSSLAFRIEHESVPTPPFGPSGTFS